MAFKRPTLKPTFTTPKELVTTIRPNGTRVGSWVPVTTPRLLPSGTPGRVGEIVDAMRHGPDMVKRPDVRPWTPPVDYLFIAMKMPEEARDEYVARCESWIEAHPPRPVPAIAPPVEVDRELIMALFKRYPGKVPPFEERLKVYKAAGHSDERLAKVVQRHAKMLESNAKRQEVIDSLFSKWPSASKPLPKPKVKKVIKAVKKRPA